MRAVNGMGELAGAECAEMRQYSIGKKEHDPCYPGDGAHICEGVCWSGRERGGCVAGPMQIGKDHIAEHKGGECIRGEVTV